MKIRLPYGRSYLTAQIPDDIGVNIIEAEEVPAAGDPLEAVQASLDNLVGDVDWTQFAGSKSVAIAVNDKTRPVPHQHLLPPLFKRLESLGIPDEAITLYVAVGTHPPMTPDEFSEILMDEHIKRYKVVSHDSENADNLTYLGETSRGTPIWANQDYVQSDLKIVIGNIEPHQFAGFSGGVKSAAIGLAGLETINKNHKLMAHPDSRLGEYDANPARQDIEEIGDKFNVDLEINAILNHNRQIVKALAGEPRGVIKAGIPLSREVCQVAVPQKYPLTITSPGGHPKDINVYQAQKALANAALITRTGGTIILIAACPEGTGSPHYEDWMRGKSSYAEVIQDFQDEGFRIGPHKAFQIARDASIFRLMSYTSMDNSLAKALLLNPINDLQTAIDIVLAELKPTMIVGVLPHATSTIPYVRDDGKAS